MRKIYNEIKNVRSGVEEINTKISQKEDKVSSPKEPLYNQIVNKQLGANINKIVKQINQDRKDVDAEQLAVKQNRTIIVKQYMDKNIRNSENVRRQIYDAFPGSVITNARTTPAGSIVVEFDDEKTVEDIIKNWDQDLFGGNKGVIKGNLPRTTGIVKHVCSHRTEEEIKEEILNKYPCQEVSFFKKNDEFMGIIKITFNTPEDLTRTMNERIKIFEQRYLVEEYIFQPRVIKCNKCQNFGHIARLCRGAERCGKCSNNHNTKNCTAEPNDYCCFHCKENHQTGDKECQVMKEKEELIKNRYSNV